MKNITLSTMRYLVGILLFCGLVVHPSYGHQSQPQQHVMCKAKNFTAFFKNFTESIEMQKLCTRFPLEKLELVDEQDDLTPKIQKILPDQITYPLILSIHSRQEQNLSLKIEVKNKKKAKVILYKPDTGYRIIYRFSKNNTWQLVKIEDWAV